MWHAAHALGAIPLSTLLLLRCRLAFRCGSGRCPLANISCCAHMRLSFARKLPISFVPNSRPILVLCPRTPICPSWLLNLLARSTTEQIDSLARSQIPQPLFHFDRFRLYKRPSSISLSLIAFFCFVFVFSHRSIPHPILFRFNHSHHTPRKNAQPKFETHTQSTVLRSSRGQLTREATTPHNVARFILPFKNTITPLSRPSVTGRKVNYLRSEYLRSRYKHGCANSRPISRPDHEPSFRFREKHPGTQNSTPPRFRKLFQARHGLPNIGSSRPESKSISTQPPAPRIADDPPCLPLSITVRASPSKRSTAPSTCTRKCTNPTSGQMSR